MNTIKTIISDHITWRYQIFKLAKSDIIKKYSGAAFGWAWALIKPLILIGVYWFAIAIGLRGGGGLGGFPFILWFIAGLVPWFYMSDMLTGGAASIRKYKYLVTKMKFPVSTIPSFVGLSNLLIHLILMTLVTVVFAVSGFFPGIYFLQLPIYALLMLWFFVVWGLFSALLSAMSRDFLNLIKSITTAVFWLSGILWDVNMIDVPWLKTILMFNPVTFFVTGYRNVFVYKIWIWEEYMNLLYFGIVFILLTLAALWAYRKLIKVIPDVL